MRRQNSFNMGTNVLVLHPRLVVAAFAKLVVVVADNAFAVAPSMQKFMQWRSLRQPTTAVCSGGCTR